MFRYRCCRNEAVPEVVDKKLIQKCAASDENCIAMSFSSEMNPANQFGMPLSGSGDFSRRIMMAERSFGTKPLK